MEVLLQVGALGGVCIGLGIAVLIMESCETNEGVKEARKLVKRQFKEARKATRHPYTKAGLRY